MLPLRNAKGELVKNPDSYHWTSLDPRMLRLLKSLPTQYRRSIHVAPYLTVPEDAIEYLMVANPGSLFLSHFSPKPVKTLDGVPVFSVTELIKELVRKKQGRLDFVSRINSIPWDLPSVNGNVVQVYLTVYR